MAVASFAFTSPAATRRATIASPRRSKPFISLSSPNAVQASLRSDRSSAFSTVTTHVAAVENALVQDAVKVEPPVAIVTGASRVLEKLLHWL